jgi:O-antigen/teichoic acid export membrane protein
MNGLLTRARERLLPIALSQWVGLLCGIVGVRIVSHWVPPATLGSYGVFLTFTTLGLWVAHAGLIKFVARHWAAATDRSALLRSSIRAWWKKLGWLALASGGAAVIIHRSGGPIIGVVVGPLFIAAALISLGVLIQNALQAEQRFWTDFGVSAVGSLSRTFLPPVLFLITGGAFGLYLGFGLHALIFAAVAGWSLREHWRAKSPSTQVVITPVYDGAFFITLSLVGWMLMGVNRWIVAGFFGETTAGFFTLAGNLAQIVPAMLGAVFVQYFQSGLFAAPHSSETERRALARRVDQIALAYTALALGGVAAVHAITPWLVGPLIDERYRDALIYLGGAGCFGVAVVIGQFFHTLLLAAHRERDCGPVDISAAVILIGGGVTAATIGGETWFLRWLLITPVIPWLLNRTLARRYLLKP